MNQILLTENTINKDNNNSKKKNNLSNIPKYSGIEKGNSTGNSIDIKKIIIFFGAALVIFGIIIGLIFAVRLLKKKNDNGTATSENKPQVSITYDENSIDNSIAVQLSSEAGIDKITYIWDDGEPITENLDGKKAYEVKKDIPAGATKVIIEVTDLNGQTTTSEQIVSSSVTDDIQIKIALTGGEDENKLKITVDSETPIQYITYKWNDEEEKKVVSQNEEEFETVIDVKRGENQIFITAVDANNKTNTLKQMIFGVKQPVIEVTRDEERLYMKVTHDKGIKSIEYDVNGQIYTYDEKYSGYDPNQIEVEFSFVLNDGENTVIIKAISNEETIENGERKNTETTYRGKCTK